MQDATIMEQNQIAFVPVVRVDVLGRNGGPLQIVHDAPHLSQIVDGGAVGAVEAAHGGGVDLQGERAGDGVFPHEGEDFDLGGIDGR